MLNYKFIFGMSAIPILCNALLFFSSIAKQSTKVFISLTLVQSPRINLLLYCTYIFSHGESVTYVCDETNLYWACISPPNTTCMHPDLRVSIHAEWGLNLQYIFGVFQTLSNYNLSPRREWQRCFVLYDMAVMQCAVQKLTPNLLYQVIYILTNNKSTQSRI